MTPASPRRYRLTGPNSDNNYFVEKGPNTLAKVYSKHDGELIVQSVNRAELWEEMVTLLKRSKDKLSHYAEQTGYVYTGGENCGWITKDIDDLLRRCAGKE